MDGWGWWRRLEVGGWRLVVGDWRSEGVERVGDGDGSVAVVFTG
jgi:hypothetical protein